MRVKIKALKKDTPEEIEAYRKLGLVFKTDHSFLNEYKIKDGLKCSEREFCKVQKITSEKFLRYKQIFTTGGERSLMGIFRKHQIKKPRSNEILLFLQEYKNDN